MEMKETILKTFAEVFGDAEGAKAYFAPGRVNLIGEHTDYNGGHVFPCALTIGTYGVARKRNDNKLRFYSMNFEHLGVIESSLDDLVPSKEANWTNYPKGVIWAFGEKGMKVPSGMDLLLNGNIPNGSGLSSSASVEVLTGYILRDFFGFDVTNQDLALIVLGISQASLFITACDHDLRILQTDRCILILQCRSIQKNSIVLFTHGNGKLIQVQ